MEPRYLRSWLAASVAGLPVIPVFTVWHWYRILPIWHVAVEGLVFAVLAGAGVGWAHHELARAGKAPRTWRGGLAFGALVASGLLVLELVGLVRGPGVVPTRPGDFAIELAVVLSVVPAMALVGWLLLRTARGAAAFAVGTLPLHVYLGGSVANRGGVGLGGELFAFLFPLEILAGALLVLVYARAGRRGA